MERYSMLSPARGLAAAQHFPTIWSRMFILYQRDDCHLCDQALAVLAQARVRGLESVFIDDDADLEARYGVRVPVLRDAKGRELDWPFDTARLATWLDPGPNHDQPSGAAGG